MTDARGGSAGGTAEEDIAAVDGDVDATGLEKIRAENDAAADGAIDAGEIRDGFHGTETVLEGDDEAVRSGQGEDFADDICGGVGLGADEDNVEGRGVGRELGYGRDGRDSANMMRSPETLDV